MLCFLHFGFATCFAYLRATTPYTFQKLNFQKCSENGVFCAFWLRGVLRATMECTFPHLSFQECSAPQMFWPFYFQICFAHLRAKVACNSSSHVCQDGSAPAALANLLFDPPELQIIGKTVCFATFLPFHAPSSSLIFFLLPFSSLTLPTSAFPSVHIVGSLTSRPPSTIIYEENWSNSYHILVIICWKFLDVHQHRPLECLGQIMAIPGDRQECSQVYFSN